MMRTRTPRRRASLLLAGAVVLSATGCGILDGGVDPSSPTSTTSQAPLSTTSTTEPTTSTSSSTVTKDPPSGSSVLTSSRNYMAASNNVTISGHFYDEERDVVITLRAEGSTGGLRSTSQKAGISRATLSVKGGGRMEVLIIGASHYVKVNKAWLRAVDAPKDSLMRKNLDTWVSVPFDNSPLAVYRPQQLLKQAFFGKSLTPLDAKKSPASFETLDGVETYRVAIRKADESGQERILWVSTDPSRPEPIRLSAGQGTRGTVLRYTDWGSSREDFAKPASARSLDHLNSDDF